MLWESDSFYFAIMKCIVFYFCNMLSIYHIGNNNINWIKRCTSSNSNLIPFGLIFQVFYTATTIMNNICLRLFYCSYNLFIYTRLLLLYICNTSFLNSHINSFIRKTAKHICHSDCVLLAFDIFPHLLWSFELPEGR